MKKILFAVFAMLAIAFSSSAVTYMRVHKFNGQIERYDVDSVDYVDFEEDYADVDSSEGVTVSGKIGNYSYVDLGLASGLKWATYNVGATQIADYGDYFAWGEVESYASKSDKNKYKWQDSTNNYTKYISDVDGLTTLLPEDDAATVNWGANWRMPTNSELQELYNGCTWKWTSGLNGSGVAGWIGTSKTNGNTIFLPVTDIPMPYDGHAIYWSSTVGCFLGFSTYDNLFNYRVHSFSVRAVTE